MAKLDDQLSEIATVGRRRLRRPVGSAHRPPGAKGQHRRCCALALGYEMQAKALGGLSRSARQQLEGRAAAKPVAPGHLAPGMRLCARAWRVSMSSPSTRTGRSSGTIANGDALSEIARAITGTRWSGPAFFGLRNGRQRHDKDPLRHLHQEVERGRS